MLLLLAEQLLVLEVLVFTSGKKGPFPATFLTYNSQNTQLLLYAHDGERTR
jgi:hypothetical protein